MKFNFKHKIASKIGLLMRKFLCIEANSAIERIRRGGGRIGQNVKFFDVQTCFIDPTRPWLLRIGDNVSITRGCVILTHDYSKIVLKNLYGPYYGEGQVTTIGNNVFIGMNSIVLMGTTIGNNVIVGAGSVCHGNYPDNVVIAGNPAKVICTLEEHHRRIKEREIKDAKQCACAYRESFGNNPSEYDMREFKHLFNDEDSAYFKRFHEFLKDC